VTHAVRHLFALSGESASGNGAIGEREAFEAEWKRAGWGDADTKKQCFHFWQARAALIAEKVAAQTTINDEGLSPRPDLECDPLWQWRCIANEAEIAVNHKGKFLMLSEEMCVRLGAALEDAAETQPAQTQVALTLLRQAKYHLEQHASEYGHPAQTELIDAIGNHLTAAQPASGAGHD
jgi:hypothetical protein